MIRVYLDWNVISQTKRGDHIDIKNILDNNKNITFFYSTAHIGDIYSSYSENEEQIKIINDDLEYLSSITLNNCISVFNQSMVTIDKIDPKVLLEQRIVSESITENFSLDFLGESLKDIGMGEIGQLYIDSLKSMPLDDAFIQTLSNPESAEILESVLPGLKDNPTMEGIFESFGKMLDKLNNSSGYDDLRRMYQKALQINPDKAFNWKDPFKEYDKILNQRFNSNIDGIKKILNKEENKYAPAWYNQIVNTYINLDMSGFKQDKVEVKNGKKNTFKNTTEDAFHAAFSTLCDIYVVNDKRSYFKVKETFKHLNINTRVFNPKEFVEYYNTFLSINQGYTTINLVLKHLEFVTPYISESETGVTKTYFTEFYFFDFFNKIYLTHFFDDNSMNLLLSKEKPTNGKFTIFEEIEGLINRLTDYFGSDTKNAGNLSISEFENLDEWTGRIWNVDDLEIKLLQINGFFQLYLIPKAIVTPVE